MTVPTENELRIMAAAAERREYRCPTADTRADIDASGRCRACNCDASSHRLVDMRLMDAESVEQRLANCERRFRQLDNGFKKTGEDIRRLLAAWDAQQAEEDGDWGDVFAAIEVLRRHSGPVRLNDGEADAG